MTREQIERRNFKTAQCLIAGISYFYQHRNRTTPIWGCWAFESLCYSDPRGRYTAFVLRKTANSRINLDDPLLEIHLSQIINTRVRCVGDDRWVLLIVDHKAQRSDVTPKAVTGIAHEGAA